MSRTFAGMFRWSRPESGLEDPPASAYVSPHLGRQLERALHRCALGEDLGVLGLRHAVSDDAGARLIAITAVAEDQRANGDRLVQPSACTEVTDRAAVESASLGLQLVDELHRAHLRRTDQRPRGKSSGKKIEPIVR